jgi:hypothetical protein
VARTLTRRRTTRSEDDYLPAQEADAPAQPDAPRRPARSEEPAAARRRRRDAEEEPAAPRRRRAAEEEEPAPRRRRAAEEERPAAVAGSGWDAFDKQRSESGDFAEEFKPDEEEVLIKFLDDAPIAVYRQHWIERTGKKSFTCLGDRCPLCEDLGDKPRGLAAFNVIDLSDPESPVVKVWVVGTIVAETLKNYAKKEKTSPLNRDDLYFSVSRSGKGAKSSTSVNPIKERDLAEDWDCEPLDEETLDALEGRAYEQDDVVQFHSRQQLQEIADEVLG